MSKKIKLENVLLILPLIFSYFFLTQLNAQTKTVSISVKLSVCGDGIVEGREDCESKNLNGETCKTLGFMAGKLRCDPSCSFNSSKCVPFPESKPDPDSTSSTVEEEDLKEKKLPDNVPDEVAEMIQQKRLEKSSKKKFLEIFDDNDDGILESKEIPTIVVTWVNAWSNSNKDPVCDLNEDTLCDIYDFSILLYYVDNTEI
jgi:hypothetical protein